MRFQTLLEMPGGKAFTCQNPGFYNTYDSNEMWQMRQRREGGSPRLPILWCPSSAHRFRFASEQPDRRPLGPI